MARIKSENKLKTSRLEAFSDGVLAIIITIMVLELQVPHTPDLAALQALWPIFLSYALSFIYVGIYWNNHHHLLAATERVNGRILWANLHLLFWLSLIPFVTAWMGENHFATWPTACYGFVLLMAAIAYFILQLAIMGDDPNRKVLAEALGSDWKGRLSPVFYMTGIALSFWSEWAAGGVYLGMALLWLMPDRRIESKLVEDL